MSQCYYTNLIRASDCIGDSLLTINANFSALDQGLCDFSQLVSGPNAIVENELTEQGKYTSSLSLKNSIAYKNSFESLNVCSEQTVSLSDGTALKTTTFPYISSTSDPKPFATFTSVSLSNTLPQVTLYWLASGVDNTTIVATNSSISVTEKGPIWLDDSVTSLAKDGDNLYIGGKFNEVGGSALRKVCQISLSEGSNHPLLSATGSVLTAPFGNLELGTTGTVNAIEVGTASGSSVLAIGGSFISATKGRGLSINRNGSQNYPFYVNGSVNALALSGNHLVVGGDFNYINYGAQSASVESGRRVNCRGFVKVNLTTLFVGSGGDQSMTPLCPIFSGKVLINTLTTKDDLIYAGGVFQIKNGERLISQNVCAIDFDGNKSPLWSPIINGPVHTLAIDDRSSFAAGIHLYIGGEFSKYHTDSTFNLSPRSTDELHEIDNACVVQIKTSSSFVFQLNNNWKPQFNGSVSKIVLNDNQSAGIIYCYGKFTSVNNESCSFLTSISKNTGASLNKFWRPSLETPPDNVNNALIHDGYTVTVGGNFTRINNAIRYHLARLTDVDNTTYTVPTLSSVAWDLGATVEGFGLPFAIDTTSSSTVRVSSYPFSFGTINETTFPTIEDTFNGLSEGQLIRFFVRRPGNSSTIGSLAATNDEIKSSVNVIGYKINYNK